MRIRVKAGDPDVQLDKGEIKVLQKAHDLANTLATYAQDSAAEDAREALAVLVGKYTVEEKA